MIFIIFLLSSLGRWEVCYENIVYGLYAVDFVDSLHGWAVGDRGFVLRTNDGGDIWDTLWAPDVPDTASGIFKLWDVCFIDSNTGWVCGDSGYIAKTVDGGDSWEIESTGFVNDLYAIEFLDSLYGWAGGENDTTLLKTTDGGNNWGKIYFNPTGHGWHVVSISMVSREIVWVILEGDALLYCTYNGGNSWNIKHSGNRGLSVFTLDSLYLWFTTDSTDGSNFVYRSSDGGESFTRTTGPIGWGLYFVDTLYGWTGGEYEGYYLTLDGGDTFEHYDTPGLGYVCDIDFVDRKHGWAAAYYPLTMERNRGEVHRWVPDAGIPEEENSKVRDVLFYTGRVFLGDDRFRLYDSSGRLLKVVNGYWDGEDSEGKTVSPGVYFGKRRKETIKIIKIRR